MTYKEMFEKQFERAIEDDLNTHPLWWITIRDSIPFLALIGIVIFFLTHPDFGKKYYFEKSNTMTIELGTTEDLVFTVKSPDTYSLTGETYLKAPDDMDSIFDYVSFGREQFIENGDTYKVSMPIEGIKRTDTYVKDGYIELILSSKSDTWGRSKKRYTYSLR